MQLNFQHLMTSKPSAARWTPAGRGAIAVIRVCGADGDWERGGRLFRPANRRAWCDQPLQRLLAGTWGREETEDVVVCRLSAGEFEVQCHGGDAAVGRILHDLNELGFETVNAESQAFTDLLDRELQQALANALTWRTANILAEQASGVFQKAFVEIGIRSGPLSPFRGGEGKGEGELLLAPEDEQRTRDLIKSLLAWSNFGLHLTRPWSVVLTGRPNVGKSSLINALLGFRRAIVADEPGTTRDVVTGVTAFDGWPVELADTAGVRETTAELEAAGIERARSKLSQADVRVVLLDQSEPPKQEDQALLAEWPDAIVVAHKADLPDRWGKQLPSHALPVSSLTGLGVDELIHSMINRIVPQEPPPGTPIPISARQIEVLESALTMLRTISTSRRS